MTRQPDRFDDDRGIDQLQQTLRGFDNLIEPAVRAATEALGHGPSCTECITPGCCFQYVLLTLAEALPLARRLVRDSRDTQEFRAQLRRAGVVMRLRGRDGWWKMAEPCALLTDGRCSVYEDRPVMCRSHYVWSEPRLCQPPKVETVKMVEMVGVGRTMLTVNLEVCQQLGLDDGRVYISNLPAMLDIALEMLDCEDRAAIEYLRGLSFPRPDDLINWFGPALAELKKPLSIQ
jgi:Fe-S-cluster containining protein